MRVMRMRRNELHMTPKSELVIACEEYVDRLAVACFFSCSSHATLNIESPATHLAGI